ncbi:MAG: metallophosphoesterase, partial [Oscillospiraceae bacterium]|nr:metallophosphoesterase [Oscillospiraceae bacterium]
MKKFLTLLLVLAMVLSCGVTAFADETEVADEDVLVIAPAPDYTGKTVILHTNDMHGAIDGYAKIAALKASYEAKGAQVILVDAGDYIQGTTNVSFSKGATAIELMNLTGYDIVTLGNHEFDYGYANLVEILAEAEFEVISNVKYNDAVAFTAATTVTTASGLTIGFVGLTTPETATKAHPAKIQGVTFTQGAALYADAQATIDTLDTDLVIVLGHLGIDEETAVSL